MDARIRDLPFAADALPGLSAQLLQSHHQNNYGGAVKRLNAIRAQWRSGGEVGSSGGGSSAAARPAFELNGLKREELIATNSMLLHELYFASLGGDGHTMAPAWQLALQANFGSVAAWREEFMAMGRALGGGSGWVTLVFQPREGTLVNQWAADHTQALAGGVPLLALDMYEHAYHLDYGAAAGAYVDAFMGNIHWSGVYERYQAAVHAASAPFAASHADVLALAARAGSSAGAGAEGGAGGTGASSASGAAHLLDVRREGVFTEARTMLPGARWIDPAGLANALPTALGADEPVIVYCVYGHEVSRAAALQLRAAGLQARFLAGGIGGWAAAGHPLAAKPAKGGDS